MVAVLFQSSFCFINFVNSLAGRGVELVLTGGSSELSGPRRVSIEELNAATKNFSSINLIGHGTFGEVYKGLLHDGTVVAIKRRPSAPNEAFVQEVFTRFFFFFCTARVACQSQLLILFLLLT